MLYKGARIPSLLPTTLSSNLSPVNCSSQMTRLPNLKQRKESLIPAAEVFMLLCHIQSFLSKTPFLDQMTFLKYLITFEDFFFCMCTQRTIPNFLSFSHFFTLGVIKFWFTSYERLYFPETGEISVD